MLLYLFDDSRLGVGTADACVVDITELIDPAVAPDRRMSALIAAWPDIADRVASAALRGPAIALDSVTIRAPQPTPSKIIAAPVNYRRHQQEMRGIHSEPAVETIETYAGFLKAPSSIIGPDQAIRLPWAHRRFDHEGELGVVIGRRASRVTREDALSHVFGFVPLLDITMRGAEDRSYRKSFDTFTPIGPAIVTADHVTDHGEIDLELTVNGEPRQRASTSELIYDIPRLIELYSAVMTLEPGDLIATGTPEGVAQIHPDDEIVLSIRGVGELTMAVTS